MTTPRIPSGAPSTQFTSYAGQPTASPAAPDPALESAQFLQVSTFLAQNMSTFGDGIDQNDIYLAAQGAKGPEVQQAAQWLMAHPQYMAQLDTAKDGKNPDGNISGDDLKMQIGRLSREQQYQSLRYDPRLPQFEASLGVLAQGWQSFDTAKDGGTPDGNISRDDINAILTNSSAPPQLRSAAYFLTSNPDLLGMLDTGSKGGTPDGNISIADLQTTYGQVSNLRASMPPPQPTSPVTAKY